MIDLDDFEITARHAIELRRLIDASDLTALPVPDFGRKTLLDENVPRLPRWPSGLYSDFDALFEGFCGITLLAGPGGCGKSTEAMSCSYENAMDPGTCVFYLDAENAQGEQIDRGMRWWGGASEFIANMRSMALRFHWLEILPGHSWPQMMREISRRIMLEHERVLIVLDSVFSIARCLGGRNVLDATSKIYLALDSLVRLSAGRIRVLALSEVNKEGGVKGLEGVYVSTLALKLEPEPDRGDNVLRLRMLKNRSGPLRRDLGLYEIDSDRCRLRRYDDPERSHRGHSDPYGLEH